MKKIVRYMILGLLCLFLIQPNIVFAASANIGIQHDNVIFKLNNDFEATEEEYRLLVFAKSEFDNKNLWVCVLDDKYEAETLKSKYQEKSAIIEDVPSAEYIAVKLFEKNSEKWVDCFGLCESKTKFSKKKNIYEAIVKESFSQEPSENENLYILMDKDETVLPLELAEELYGFNVEIKDNSVVIYCSNDVLENSPVLFNCIQKEWNGIALEKLNISVQIDMTESNIEHISVESEKETRVASEKQEETEYEKEQTDLWSETEILEDSDNWSDIKNEDQSETKESGESEEETEKRETDKTEIWTEKNILEETETQTESWTETESEIEKQKNISLKEVNETGNQEVGLEESVTENPYLTEELLTEKEEDSDQKRFGSMNIFIIIAVIVVFLISLMIFLWSMKYLKSSKERIVLSDYDDEDTINPEKTETLPLEKISIKGAVANNKGSVRGNNEDNFYFNGTYMHREKMDEGAFLTGNSKESVQMYAVCDGMGGADSGEEASYRAVRELFLRKQDHQKMMDSKEMISVLREISEKIYVEAVQRGQKSGTTIVLMLVAANQVVFSNVGDSRIYRFRKRKLTQISVDHSKVQRMISMGILTPEQAKKDPSRHIITQYIGMPPEVQISPYIVSDEKLYKDDIYLLCSDGLTDMVEDSEIEAILKEKEKPQEAVQTLLKAALDNGGRDNVTIMLLRV